MKLTNEQMQEEKSNLEQELRKLQVELVDILNLNDSLVAKNNEKDSLIARKEAILQEIQVKANQDKGHLALERQAMIDYQNHQEDLIKCSIKRLELMKNRQDHLETENKMIQQSIDNIHNAISKEGDEHAHELHEMNRHMLQVRRQLEHSFKKELIDMDLLFQKQAFTELNESHKRAMLINSKLQDELALQTVGIANLTVRCGRDKTSYKEVKAEMKRIEEKVNEMRERMTDLQFQKMRQTEKINELQSKVNIYKNRELAFKQEIDKWISLNNLQKLRDELLSLIELEREEFQFWSHRYKKIKKYDQVSMELLLRDDTKHLEMNETTDTLKNANENGSTTADNPSNMSSLNLVEEIQLDPDLRLAFRPLAGKESNLLPSRGHISVHIKQLFMFLKRDHPQKLHPATIENNNKSPKGSRHASFGALQQDDTKSNEYAGGRIHNEMKYIKTLRKSADAMKLDTFIATTASKVPRKRGELTPASSVMTIGRDISVESDESVNSDGSESLTHVAESSTGNHSQTAAISHNDMKKHKGITLWDDESLSLEVEHGGLQWLNPDKTKLPLVRQDEEYHILPIKSLSTSLSNMDDDSSPEVNTSSSKIDCFAFGPPVITSSSKLVLNNTEKIKFSTKADLMSEDGKMKKAKETKKETKVDPLLKKNKKYSSTSALPSASNSQGPINRYANASFKQIKKSMSSKVV